jgi:hypothetical protein
LHTVRLFEQLKSRYFEWLDDSQVDVVLVLKIGKLKHKVELFLLRDLVPEMGTKRVRKLNEI